MILKTINECLIGTMFVCLYVCVLCVNVFAATIRKRNEEENSSLSFLNAFLFYFVLSIWFNSFLKAYSSHQTKYFVHTLLPCVLFVN